MTHECVRAAEGEASGNGEFAFCGWVIIVLSYTLVAVTLPLSLMFCLKVRALLSALPC